MNTTVKFPYAGLMFKLEDYEYTSKTDQDPSEWSGGKLSVKEIYESDTEWQEVPNIITNLLCTLAYSDFNQVVLDYIEEHILGDNADEQGYFANLDKEGNFS